MNRIGRPYSTQPSDELHAVMEAVSDWLNALDRQGDAGTWADLDDLLPRLGRAARYADCCTACRELIRAFPHSLVEKGGGWIGTYRCPSCSHTWTCWWADDISMLA